MQQGLIHPHHLRGLQAAAPALTQVYGDFITGVILFV